MSRLLSVNVGLPRELAWRGETVRTAIWKQPVAGRVAVRRLNLEGDGQGDLAGHGGEQRAVMVYQMDSYRYWERYLQRHNFRYGQFSENFTVEGLPDDEVRVGDRYRIGTASFEVTQPRVTCYRVGIRLDEPQMASLLVAHHRPGFYLRVLEEGEVSAGDEIFPVSKGPEPVTVAEIDALLYLPGHPRELLERVLRIPALSSGWKASLQALLEQKSEIQGAGNAGLTAAVGPPPAWTGFRFLRVARITRESDRIRSFSFEDTDGSPLPAALPGQFVVLKLSPKPEAPPLLRSYSLSGPPGDHVYRVSVKQETNGAASTFLHQHVRMGDLLEVSAPRGSFTLRPGDGPVVLMSAGIGATPVLAMLHALASAATSAARPVWWLYGARSRDDHPFVQEARALLQSLTHGRSYIVYSRPSPADRIGEEYDATGHLSVSALARRGVPLQADFYLCGPASFLRDLTADLGEWGVPSRQVHTETFAPEASLRPGLTSVANGPVHPLVGEVGTGPQVAFVRSGLTVAWHPRFHNLLELAEACHVSVRWSCRTGVCHTCESGLIGGTVAYQPDPLEPAAAGNILLCCAQPCSDLELDL